ncbi:MAG: insulinase family protein, partial [Sphingopyxis sp.]
MNRYFSRGAGFTLLCATILAAAPTHAEGKRSAAQRATPTAQAIDRGAWLYTGSDIPPDAAWQFGTLPNGLRLAVRHNGVPPGQVTIRLRVDAGSLMERPDEAGWAHMIEHLTF